MLTTPAFRSVEDDAYLACLQLASAQAEHRIAARGGKACEVIGVGFQLSDPRQRLPYLAARKANPVFQYAEALLYLGGRRDLEMIGYYAPFMRAGSPIGIRRGESAYGHTIFTPADDGLSTFDRILDLLRTGTDSKRGYLPVFSPAELAVSDNHLGVRRGTGLRRPGGPPVSDRYARRNSRIHRRCQGIRTATATRLH
ncbi:hypothetical protein GCM10010277_77600 [Streptomyces longisporoflavus]|uniref:hypothetical protein n=1 Tax=Streptomyces longisporoflavus TaxID=28044 RepID=UPI00167C4892|nr:hypothetical protein [Streptomyces longisporoflavus]GGV68375.1 hypothetical protein GCM10010277_77600 [Streptomyces longisporoflavus]